MFINDIEYHTNNSVDLDGQYHVNVLLDDGDGVYTIYTMVRDVFGRLSLASDVHTIELDTLQPKVNWT